MSASVRVLARLLVAALTVTLLTVVGQPQAAHASAAEVAALVNATRASAGVHALRQAPELDAVAQAWSQQMAAGVGLKHNPHLSSQVGNWRAIGENVGRGGSASSVHAAFLASPGHRANILDAGYTEVGVGFVRSGNGVWITQVFRTPIVPTPAPAPAPAPAGAHSALPPGTATGQDFDGDGVPDTFGRLAGTGQLWFYPADRNGAARARIAAGEGWNIHDTLLPVTDVSGDGHADLWAREAATGTLWLYTGDGRGGFTSRRAVGAGWGMHNALLSAGDVTGDGHADLWAREAATGLLWLYSGDGSGGFNARRAVGAGWGMHNTVIGVADIDRDGHPDVLARETSTGTRWLYLGDGQGGFNARRPLDHGWSTIDVLF